MGGSQKSKRVSWASDVNLCQVRLFLSEECPSQVGSSTQDQLQAKALWQAHAGGMGPDENLPPGFEGIQPANPWTIKLSQIPLTKWKCPPRYEVNSEWKVVAGEESNEVETQNQRELRVLEAIYPRPSAIPLNPCALVGMEDTTNNSQHTPVVPITGIEDEDASLDITPIVSHGTFSSQGKTAVNGCSSSANVFPTTDSDPDIMAAAQAALSSIMCNNSDQGNLIDRELLIKLLTNPKTVEHLITNRAAASSSGQQSMPSSSSFHGPQNLTPSVGMKIFASSTSPGMPSTSTQYISNLRSPPINSYDPVSANGTRPELVPPSMATANGPFYPPSRMGSIPNLRTSVPDVISAPSPSVVKDINYYKSLIQQHGGERRESTPQFGHQNNQYPGTNQEPMNKSLIQQHGGERRESTPQFGHQMNQYPGTNQEPMNMMMKPRESKPKMKPCMYFNSPRGCRNGANCTFQHDVAPQQKGNGVAEVQSSKRMKLDREIFDS